MGIFRKKPKTEAPGVAEVDFATLAAEAAAGTKTQNDLWGAVYDLPQWHFIGHGEMPNTRPPLFAKSINDSSTGANLAMAPQRK